MTADVTDWHTRSAAVEARRDAFIDGEFVAAGSGLRTPSINPATGGVLSEVAECDAADVDRAVGAARAAFEFGAWSRIAPAERKAALLRLASLVRDNAEELALLDSLDAGKLITDTSTIDVTATVAIFEWYAEAIDKQYGEIAPTAPGNLALVSREPVGVVGAVVPWNFPLEMATWKLAPALAAGNSIVLKPADESPLSALRLAELAIEAGLPRGVLNVVPGAGEVTGRALGLHEDVDSVTFTGSTPVGALFLQYAAASNSKQVWLECGGKSPNIVFADNDDLDTVADAVCFGIFTNAGQVCSANSRLLVHSSVKDAVLDRVVDRAKSITPGDPLDPSTRMGPLVSSAQADRVMGFVEQAQRDSRLVTGGTRLADAPHDTYVEPTIFDDVAEGSTLARDEVFGPVLAVFEFDDEEQAIRMANSSVYGLAASVWTSDISRAHRLSSRLRVGTVSVNTVDALDVTTPFGGFGRSGFGRDLSLHSLDKYTALKTTWISYRDAQ